MSNVTNKQKLEKLQKRIAEEEKILAQLSAGGPITESWDELSKYKRSEIRWQNTLRIRKFEKRLRGLYSKLRVLEVSAKCGTALETGF